MDEDRRTNDNERWKVSLGRRVEGFPLWKEDKQEARRPGQTEGSRRIGPRTRITLTKDTKEEKEDEGGGKGRGGNKLEEVIEDKGSVLFFLGCL